MYDTIKAMKALSDDTRLRMLCLLTLRECCVCEVMQTLSISQTRASRNLNMLYDAGFLKMRKEGLWSLYSIDEEAMKGYLGDLTRVVSRALADNQITMQDRERLTRAKRVGPGCVNKVSSKASSRHAQAYWPTR